MVHLRFGSAFFFLCLTGSLSAQSASLPDAPSTVLLASVSDSDVEPGPGSAAVSSSATYFDGVEAELQSGQDPTDNTHGDPHRKPVPQVQLDANGNPIPLSRRQPDRILGFMPNFRSVSAGYKPHPPGWKYNFEVATHQAFDYSSFLFLGLTTISAEGLNEHPVLGKGVHGFYSYGWRGLLDKTDGTYIGAWFLPSLLHEDTRYYALGPGHSILYRSLYVMSRQVVTRTYGGRDTPNIAGLGGKVLTQIVSREYYPTGATSFGVLAEKFGYATMRDIAFTSVREFYPDIAGHYVRKHHEKQARLAAQQSARDAAAAGTKP
jgi:hypothetical protein